MKKQGDWDATIAEICSSSKFLLTTHENPDGDALGSLLAMDRALNQLGKDTYMFMSKDEFPLPKDYLFLGLDRVEQEPPQDWQERAFVFLDCGNIDRMPADFLQREDAQIINIDHHHDNTRFGTVNLVEGKASCTAEIVYDLLKLLNVDLTVDIGEPLYVGLITDTGKFMYKNTGAKAHMMAADLIERGVDVHGTFKKLYEDMPFAKLALLTRVLSRAERFDDGKIIMAQLLREDYDYAEAEASFSEGIIDHIRAIEGAKVAIVVRELLNGEDNKLKVSLRATDDSVDVSVIARKAGGGGHPQAAGFTTDMTTDKIISFVRSEVAEQLDGSRRGQTPSGV